MFKIKLLISLLISLVALSCTGFDAQRDNTRFSLDSVGGGFDGLLLYNSLDTHLRSYGMIDNNSRYEIRSSISHATGVYVTNIDNTSNRESIESYLNVIIYDKELKCDAYSYNNEIYQFYIFASNEKFISNKVSLKKIKSENTEELVKRFINTLMYEKVKCKFSEVELNSLRDRN